MGSSLGKDCNNPFISINSMNVMSMGQYFPCVSMVTVALYFAALSSVMISLPLRVRHVERFLVIADCFSVIGRCWTFWIV